MRDDLSRYRPNEQFHPSEQTRREIASNSNAGGAVGDLLYVLHAVQRHRWLVLGALLIGVGAALAYSLLIEPTYQAQSVTLVNTDKHNATMVADMLEDALSLRRSNRTIENELERLRQSTPLAERVVAHLDSAALAREADLEGEVTSLKLAQYLLEERVSFDQTGEDVDLIKITATAPDAQEAARIANVYAEEYLRHSRYINQSSASAPRSFLQEQVEESKLELEQAELELEQFMETHDAVALDAKEENAVEQIAALDAQLEEARVNLGVEQAALQELENRIERIQPNLQRRVSSSVRDEINALQEKVAVLEAQASDYYAQDPSLRGHEARNAELASLQVRIEQARSRLDSLAQRYVEEVLASGGTSSVSAREGTEDDGLAYVSELRREAIRRSIQARGLEARIAALQQQIEGYERRLRRMPQQAIRLAQLQRSRKATEQMFLLLREKLQEASVAEESQIGYVELVRPALVPDDPVAPNLPINLLLGALLGLALGTGGALVRQATSQRIHTPDDLRGLDFEVIGLVPEWKHGNDQTELGAANSRLPSGDGAPTSNADQWTYTPSAIEVEAFRHIRTNLQLRQSQARPQVIAVTSPRMGEGKTSIALGLADVIAQAGLRTLLVDADLRRPAVHRYLGMCREDGLTDLLQSSGGIPPSWEAYRVRKRRSDKKHLATAPGDGTSQQKEGYVLHSEVSHDPTRRDIEEVRPGEVYFIPAGRPVRNASELLGSVAMRAFLDEARNDFDVVIIDTSPILTVTDPVLTATLCDATLLVAAADQTSQQSLLRARERLESVGAAAPLAGVVLNRIASAKLMRVYGYGYNDYVEDGYVQSE